jgi:hypothetical protein
MYVVRWNWSSMERNYSISKPIVQYYFTVFVGHPALRPVIKGQSNFKGIALIDTDVYDDKTGQNYWTNQNKWVEVEISQKTQFANAPPCSFYRQIRNFVLDLTSMPKNVTGGPLGGAPVGIHWQVSQGGAIRPLIIMFTN